MMEREMVGRQKNRKVSRQKDGWYIDDDKWRNDSRKKEVMDREAEIDDRQVDGQLIKRWRSH